MKLFLIFSRSLHVSVTRNPCYMWRLEKGLCFPLDSYGASHSIGAEMDTVIDIKGDCEIEETE